MYNTVIMSTAPFEIKPEVLSVVYYSGYLTLLAGKKYATKYPCFESIGITIEPNPSFVVSCKDQTGFAFLVSVFEPLRNRYECGICSPAPAVTKNKMVFSFFTHSKMNYIQEFLSLLGCDDESFLKTMLQEFKRPTLCKPEPLNFDSLKKCCDDQYILSILQSDTCDSNKLQILFDHYILLSNDLEKLHSTIIRFASLAIKRKMFKPITSLVNCGLNLLSRTDDHLPLLNAISLYLDQTEAIALLQFALRYYVNEYYLDCVLRIIDLCKIHRISLDEPDPINGRTALHYACIKGYDDIIELLIDSGADTTIKDAFGKTPDLYFEKLKSRPFELR